ncbi:hypothetical protein [Modicisalibacter coralii]|uniref:hypothetical protein n=1 Tax=Modicisalibacter coralii TaxID=2304602 RepID=UPI0013968A1C|nr:hypothetical protein [Halomonas coralii]
MTLSVTTCFAFLALQLLLLAHIDWRLSAGAKTPDESTEKAAQAPTSPDPAKLG